jgi:hypothetical protein
MYSVHDEMYKFYDKHVRLQADKQKELAGYRDTNLERLQGGLESLGYALPIRNCDQGSYAMSTMVQHPDNDYDIDTAIIFASDDLPASPLKARQKVLEGVEEGGGNFKEPPEARTNAVTVWYAEGHHVDLAVYRAFKDEAGYEIIEHAGAEWTRRDPQDITAWFKDEVATKSRTAELGATVKEGQKRRIVQLLKIFAKSRASWKLPGGLIISVLVSECYRANSESDDVSLYNTMYSIRSRLASNCEVWNPVEPSLQLTYKDEYLNQVKRFKEVLDKALDWLNPLFDNSCDSLTAYRAWNDVFKHEYWCDLITGEESRNAVKHVSSLGTVYTFKSSESTLQIPQHRFYGDK